MASDPTTSVSDDEPVGHALKRLRLVRRMSGQKLASIVHISQSTISRIERGIGTPDPEDVRKIALALGADDLTVEDLAQRAERSHDWMTEWRPTSAGLASRQKNLADWEAEADTIFDFQPAVFPGLLQTSGYATAILQLFESLRQLSAEELFEASVLSAVSVRVRRQEILADRTKSFFFIVTESALRSPFCPPAQMLAQIHHIRNISARYSNVSIGVIVDEAASTIPPLHGFTLLDDKLVEIDVYYTGLFSRGRKDVESYRRIFELFRADARNIEPTLDKYEAHYLEMLRINHARA